jgi:hypothetical protein
MARYDRDMPDGGGDLGFYAGLGQEGEKGTTIAEQNAADAAARAAQSAPALTRAQQVTAARLASSPIAQEAARTTAALKSFTAKGGLLGVPGSNVKPVDPASLAKKDSNIFQMLGGILYFSGVPFTGTSGNKKYENGIEVGTVGEIIEDDSEDDSTTTLKSDAQIAADLAAAEKKAERQSAYDLLYSQFKQYGLEALVEPLKGLITTGVSPSEFTIKLRETDAYKKRFAANAQRVAKGLRSLSEAEYIELEDQYQDVMRRYGLPENYYTRGDMGRQEGFEKFLAGDVSPVELEDRIQTAQKRVLNANPEVTQALKQFYPDITNADILAYTLDPKNAIENIKRKVTAAEIGGAAIQSGLQTGMTRAEELRAAGVTKETAQQGFGTIAGGLERGSQLASIYGNDAYNQATAETEVFGLAGAQEARKQRQKITGLEKATFGGQTGVTSGALARDRAGAY